ncbi:hypothetical protein ABT346_14310 [Micromonospora peucetia]|uniref:hypothetical protein n=1 Tax=Micromonospora peucetia TaxID=47871 RepID=UPI003332879C
MNTDDFNRNASESDVFFGEVADMIDLVDAKTRERLGKGELDRRREDIMERARRRRATTPSAATTTNTNTVPAPGPDLGVPGTGRSILTGRTNVGLWETEWQPANSPSLREHITAGHFVPNGLSVVAASADPADLPTNVDSRRDVDLPQNGKLECGPRADAPPATGTASLRDAGVILTQSRSLSRAANSAIDASAPQAASSLDLRTMSDSNREHTRTMVAEFQTLLGRCPAEALGAEGSAMVVRRVAALAGVLIADRDERTALRLVRVARPHLDFLGRRHPDVFEVRRVWANALSELGHHQQAQKMLRGLSQDERDKFGSDNPQTTMLLLWALVGSGRLLEADAGFRALNSRLACAQNTSELMLSHARCRYSWVLGQQRRFSESARSYDGVIVIRSHLHGNDHPDTSDARHSKGKMLVLAGKGAKAITLLQSLAEDRARTQGNRHPDTLETLKYLHLSRAQAEPRDSQLLHQAIKDLGEILRLQIESHGRSHPVTRDTAASLRELLDHQNRVVSIVPGSQHPLFVNKLLSQKILASAQ